MKPIVFTVEELREIGAESLEWSLEIAAATAPLARVTGVDLQFRVRSMITVSAVHIRSAE